MDDGIFLQSVEGLGDSPFASNTGEVWALLQGEKEEVCQEILAAGSLVHANPIAVNERDLSEEYTEEIDLRHRDQLEGRLRDIIDAQDRLADGRYGRCAECGEQIGGRRLTADPATSMCISCKGSTEIEATFHTM